jgi:hypothetical protein
MVGTSRGEIRQLASADAGPCVSLVLPTHRAGNQIRQDPVRLQNLLGEAEEQLEARDLRPDGVRQLLAPARELVGDEMFWRHQTAGLALYSSAGGFWRIHLPHEVEEVTEVSDRFFIKPLLPMLTGDGRFYILALSQHNVRLFDASRYRARELRVEGMPRSLEDALGYDVQPRTLQFHTRAPSHGGQRRDAVFHGHGGGTDDRKEDVARFCRMVDERILTAVNDRNAPLVVAAVDWVASSYREVSKYPALVEDNVEGNPDALGAPELCERAFPLAEPRLRDGERQAAERLAHAVHHGGGSADVDAIVGAAFDGRVEALFVAVDQPAWGRFDVESRRVEMHHLRADGDDDLVNLAAALTLQHDGAVYASLPKDLPGSTAAALFRY